MTALQTLRAQIVERLNGHSHAAAILEGRQLVDAITANDVAWSAIDGMRHECAAILALIDALEPAAQDRT